MPKLTAIILTLLLAAPALAHHRQTPALFRFTDSGDNALPRVSTFASAFALVLPQTAGEGPIVSFDYPYPTMRSVASGSDANPTVSSGRVVVWDADPFATGDRQLYMRAGTLDPAQIWCANVNDGTARRVTSAPAPSSNPAISADGRLVGFESRADLPGDGHDTNVSQIFVYHVTSGNFARITNDTSGCSGPSVHRFRADWRIGFVCGGQGYYYLLRAAQRFQVPIEPGGNVAGLLAELNPQFLLLSTTANLIDGGLTTGHQVYLVNLFKRPATPVPGTAVWFPEQGIP